MSEIKKGDGIVIYRTAEKDEKPWYKSVATSICTVAKTAKISDFKNEDDFITQLTPYSVFSEAELRGFYRAPKWKTDKMVIIKMLYNLALPI